MIFFIPERITNMTDENNLKERWEQSPENKKLPKEVSLRLWRNIQQNIRTPTFGIYRISWAAAVILLIGGIIFITKINTAANIEVRTAQGEIRLVKLSDGTKVWVNEHSDFSYPEKFSDDERKVQLNGEAFFEVAKDPEHPFIISSDGVKTKVLGTSFTIYARDKKDTYVSVVTGKVNVQKTDTKIETNLLPGEKGNIEQNKNKIIITSVRPQPPVWKHQILDIGDKTLKEVVAELEKKYNKKIEINNGTLANEKLNGVLDLRKSLHENLNILTFTLNANIETNDHVIMIK
ncbi:FecR domain-containing protein [Chryseobacterium oranimense]|uniref:FecR family protein n=1 Tax=Chryseobacterium oranimense TaxID=421058 RepID=UPI0021AFB023|nr:FecR domain-containing protein [Chryseobacterium oranimense]UWX61216.1 FecR domain-containing protein [Chryseobacterium oranimense]